MKKYRIFIAINFPPGIKKELLLYQKRWENLPVRWTREDNLHITLVFLGYVREENLLEILEVVRKIVKDRQPFSLHFQRISLGPPKRPPRMIWIEGEESRELTLLRNDLEKELTGLKSKEENRKFKPHMTLGRIKMQEWFKLQQKPKIEEKISLSARVDSIEVMESRLRPAGPDYFILNSTPLG